MWAPFRTVAGAFSAKHAPVCAQAPDGQAVTANALAQYIHRLTATSLDEREHLTVSTDILSTYQKSIVMSNEMLNPPLPPADPTKIYDNKFSREQYLYLKNENPKILESNFRGRLLDLEHEAHENEKFVRKMRTIMEVDQGDRNICVTCAFLSMLCMQLSDLGINVTATSMLQQMDTAGASWLKGAGTQPTTAEFEEFMKKQWFLSKDGKTFRVSIAMSVCFNPQCTFPGDKRNQRIQTSYKNLLFDHIRQCYRGAKFVIGLVNLLPVFVDGKNMSTNKIIHEQPREECHAFGLFSADRSRVKCWNSWSGKSKVVVFKPEYILSFIVTNITQLEVQDSAQRVTHLMHAEPVQSDWFAHSTLYSHIERHMLTSWLGCDKSVYYYEGNRTEVKQYASQPMPQTAAKQAIKPPPAQAHNPDSTQDRPKKRSRTVKN